MPLLPLRWRRRAFLRLQFYGRPRSRNSPKWRRRRPVPAADCEARRNRRRLRCACLSFAWLAAPRQRPQLRPIESIRRCTHRAWRRRPLECSSSAKWPAQAHSAASCERDETCTVRAAAGSRARSTANRTRTNKPASQPARRAGGAQVDAQVDWPSRRTGSSRDLLGVWLTTRTRHSSSGAGCATSVLRVGPSKSASGLARVRCAWPCPVDRCVRPIEQIALLGLECPSAH